MSTSKVNFIHIPKNGGMSIRHNVELKNQIVLSTPNRHKPGHSEVLKTIMSDWGEHHGYEHARWRDLNDQAKTLPSFAFVRNPWSRTVSRYTFLMHLFEKGNRIVLNNPHYQQKTFREFLDERLDWYPMEYFWHRAIRGWYQQKDYVVDEDGNLRCDILRTEHLNDDINRYFGVNIDLRKRNVSNTTKKDYREFYDEESYNIVGDWYKEDIDFFGFTFNGPATRNICSNI